MITSTLPQKTLGCTRTTQHDHHRDYYAKVRSQEECFGCYYADEYTALHESPTDRAEFEKDWGQPPTLGYFEDFAHQMSELEDQYWSEMARQDPEERIEDEKARVRALGPAHPDFFTEAAKAVFAKLDADEGVPEGTSLQTIVDHLVLVVEAAGDQTGLGRVQR